VNDEGTVQPVATSDVHLSDDDRRRIAAELGLTEDQYEAVPAKLSIARYNEDDVGGDVGSFLGQQMGGVDVSQEIALSPATQFQTVGTQRLSAARIPGSILIPV
jgi:hypothetical protein